MHWVGGVYTTPCVEPYADAFFAGRDGERLAHQHWGQSAATGHQQDEAVGQWDTGRLGEVGCRQRVEYVNPRLGNSLQ
jgi:hypothetical protein